jgi:hypothetical protein
MIPAIGSMRRFHPTHILKTPRLKHSWLLKNEYFVGISPLNLVPRASHRSRQLSSSNHKTTKLNYGDIKLIKNVLPLQQRFLALLDSQTVPIV